MYNFQLLLLYININLFFSFLQSAEFEDIPWGEDSLSGAIHPGCESQTVDESPEWTLVLVCLGAKEQIFTTDL